jgi:hypothetical protein
MARSRRCGCWPVLEPPFVIFRRVGAGWSLWPLASSYRKAARYIYIKAKFEKIIAQACRILFHCVSDIYLVLAPRN